MARYNPKGTEKWLFFPTAATPADLTAITQAEITGGTVVDMTGAANSEALVEAGNWVSSPSVINTPDILSTDTGNVEGDSTRGIATMQYYLDSDQSANVIKAAFPAGTVGTMVKFPQGTAASTVSEAIPCTCVLNQLDDVAGPKMYTLHWSQGSASTGIVAA